MRIAYLKRMKFSEEAIVHMINDYPPLLSYSIMEMDKQFGYIQQELKLTGVLGFVAL